MKITGERVVSPAGGFNPTWQRHVAAYAFSEVYLGPGRLLDLGVAWATATTCSASGNGRRRYRPRGLGGTGARNGRR